MKKTFAFLSLILALSASAAWANNSSTASVGIDQGAARMFVGSGGVLDVESGGDITYATVSSGIGKKYTAKGVWTPAIGTGVGTYSLGVQLPAGAVILGGYADAVTKVDGTTSATLGFGIQSPGDLLAATSIGTGSSFFVTTSPKTLVPSFTAGAIKLTTARFMSAIITTGTLSVGKVNVFVEYYLSN